MRNKHVRSFAITDDAFNWLKAQDFTGKKSTSANLQHLLDWVIKSEDAIREMETAQLKAMEEL